jgi:hypothetical protein
MARAGAAPDRAAARRTAEYQSTAGQEHDMARFMDFHEDLKLPAEAIAQIAEDTRADRADRFGVRQIELYHKPRREGVLPARHFGSWMPGVICTLSVQ